MNNACTWRPSMVTLTDGTRVLCDSEEFRFECEAKHILDNYSTPEARRIVMYGELNNANMQRQGGKGTMIHHRGEAYMKRLEERIRFIWAVRKAERQTAKAVA